MGRAGRGSEEVFERDEVTMELWMFLCSLPFWAGFIGLLIYEMKNGKGN